MGSAINSELNLSQIHPNNHRVGPTFVKNIHVRVSIEYNSSAVVINLYNRCTALRKVQANEQIGCGVSEN